MPLKLLVTITGDDTDELDLALSEVRKLVVGGFTSGANRNETSEYSFSVETIEAPEEDGPYYDSSLGEEISYAEIKASFERGDATLIHSHNLPTPGVNTALSLDHEDFDMRGHCALVWEEVWTTKPTSLQECLDAAKGH